MADETRASQPSVPVTVTFPYRLSAAGKEQFIGATGVEPPERPQLLLNLAKVAPDLRARAAALRNKVPPTNTTTDAYGLSSLVSVPVLDEVTDDAAVVVGAWEAFVEKQQEEKDKAAAAQRDREAKAAEESARFKGQMTWWITDHGSEALRTAHLRGYNVVGLYIRERVAKEFPGFLIDSQKKAKWEDRANPSKAALALETDTLERAAPGVPRPHVRIVWLTRSIEGQDYKPFIRFGGAGPQPREAVVVQGFLGRYTLVRDVAPDTLR